MIIENHWSPITVVYQLSVHSISTVGPTVNTNTYRSNRSCAQRLPIVWKARQGLDKLDILLEDASQRLDFQWWNWLLLWESNWLIDWLYQSFTAHQHQKGHTVPKQVSPLDDDDDITESTRKKCYGSTVWEDCRRRLWESNWYFLNTRPLLRQNIDV